MPKVRKMLSDWNASYIQSIVKVMETQSKNTLTQWAIDYAEEHLLPLWQKHFPLDPRPQNSLKAARDWMTGTCKLPEAKKVILECHAAARESESNPVAQASARAIGQSASTIHSAKHAIGLVLYGALAIAYDKMGIKAPWEELEKCAAKECELMLQALQLIAVKDELNPAKLDWNC